MGQVNTTLDLHNDTSSTSSDSLLAGVEDKRIKARGDGRTPASGEDHSDDSGYRESGDSYPSQEDSETSTSETSNGGSTARPRPLAPTCNITLIRDDLTTILCEVTSSIRTRSSKDESHEGNQLSLGQMSPVEKSGIDMSKDGTDDTVQESSTTEDSKELLLCLRPIRDGDETTGEDLRFIMNKSVGKIFTNDDNGKETNNAIGVTVMNNTKMNCKMSKDGKGHCIDDGSTKKMKQSKCRPMKKRLHTASTTNGVVSGNSSSEEPANKKLQRTKSSPGGRAIDAEKS